MTESFTPLIIPLYDDGLGLSGLIMFELICPYCGWEGTDATFDAHMNPFCPECEKPLQLKEFYRKK